MSTHPLAVQSDPQLRHGFNLIGISQGTIITRAYVQHVNNPPVYNLLSLCGPQMGVGECPSEVPKLICDVFNLSPYTAHFSFSGYWKDVANETQYLRRTLPRHV
jgi:palmitoyl-protein thioesterase